jgi:hypothetical protein
MTASTISGTRSTLASAFNSLAANVFSSVPESPIPPAIVIVPNSPYMETALINDATTKVKLNFAVTVMVQYNSNAAALDNLEQLLIGVLAAMPAGYIVGNVEKPTVLEIGASPVLAADINVSTYYTQTN